MRKSLRIMLVTSSALLLLSGIALADGSAPMRDPNNWSLTSGAANLSGNVQGINPSLWYPNASATASTTQSVASIEVCARYSLNTNPSCKPGSYTTNPGTAKDSSPQLDCLKTDIALGSASYSDPSLGYGYINGAVSPCPNG